MRIMSKLNGTQTEKNIAAAFAGESQARNRYTFFAEQAKKEGNEEIAQLFERMAKNETAHARLWFKMMNGGDLNDSGANIQQAAQGEHGEWHSMYPKFAKQAREEGLDDIADVFEKVAEIERDHEYTFLKAFVSLKAKTIQNAAAAPQKETVEKMPDERPVFRCMFCGAVFDKRPDVCNVCGAIGSFEAGMAKR